MADFPDLSAHQVYACGAPIVVDGARRDFTSVCRLPEAEFFADGLTEEVINSLAQSPELKVVGRTSAFYFKDKNELFRAAIDNAIQEAFLLFTRHREMGAYADANEAIRAWFDVHMILHRQLRNVIKIGIDCNCFKEALPDVMEPIRHFYVEERRILRDIFSRHESTKRLSDIESTALATLISTSLDGILTRSLLLDDFDMDETARDFERLISCFLMNR